MSLEGPTSGSGQSGDFLSMVSLLSSPDELKAKYAELQSRQDRLQAVIDLVGPATEIRRIRGEINALKVEAEKALTAARIEAQRIAAQAATQATNTVQGANATLRDTTAKAEALRKEAESLKSQAAAEASRHTDLAAKAQLHQDELNSREARLIKREGAISENERSLAARASALAKLFEEVKARVASL